MLVKKLKFTTKDGNRLEADNLPISLCIEMLFEQLSPEQKEKVLKELQAKK